MKKVKVGIIRVLTTQDQDVLYAHERILRERFDSFEIETSCIPGQPKGIHNDETEKIAVPKIVKLAREFEEKGVDVVFISCAADPGVEECRKVLKLPVIGAGSSCAALALSIGRRVGVMGITDEAPDVMIRILKDKFICNIKPEGVNTTIDLYTEQGRKSVMEAARFLKERGCDTIALGCTGMSTIKIYKKISEAFKVQVIDPVIAAGTIISYLNL